ncbi:hypothetical protein TRIP_C60431 [Candidatus Zixiibacteriota bacterium]|nr:hypothetical protein TRIP_C60431 [candidate division Zixibacteria bacterium]
MGDQKISNNEPNISYSVAGFAVKAKKCGFVLFRVLPGKGLYE